jgi:hypothetical protein
MEGLLVPLGNETSLDDPLISAETELFRYFAGEPHRGTGAVHGLTEADAARIDAMLGRHGAFVGIRVDRERLGRSMEAWVHVQIAPHAGVLDLLEGVIPRPTTGVLTWTNTD